MMTSPPGTYQQSCSFSDGTTVMVVVNFDVTTGAIHDVGSPPAALVVTNGGPITAPVIVTGPSGARTFNVPPGTTTRTAAQMAAVGFSTKADVQQMSVACGRLT